MNTIKNQITALSNDLTKLRENVLAFIAQDFLDNGEVFNNKNAYISVLTDINYNCVNHGCNEDSITVSIDSFYFKINDDISVTEVKIEKESDVTVTLDVLIDKNVLYDISDDYDSIDFLSNGNYISDWEYFDRLNSKYSLVKNGRFNILIQV